MRFCWTIGQLVILGCSAPPQPTTADSARRDTLVREAIHSPTVDSILPPQDSTTTHPLTEDEAVAQAVQEESLAQRKAVARMDSFTTRLPPSAYPQLPTRVRQALEEVSCLVPQMWGLGDRPNNVMIADLLGNSHRAAAILCLIGDNSVIYVFDLDSIQPPDLIGAHPAHEYVGSRTASDGVVTYQWDRAISTIHPKEASEWCLYPDTVQAHEGIIDFDLQILVGAYYRRSPDKRWSGCHVPDGD